tara:strand:+ start:1315 stop:2349 length:1035 start_codon:yes stop_codon:yes gene_type:complete
MELTFTPYRIECTHPFGISRSTHNHYDIIYIYLESDGTVGRGEAAPSNRYGETFSDCIEILNTFPSTLPDFEQIQDLKNYINPYTNGVRSLDTAFSMAMFDLLGKHSNQPVYEMLGFEKDITQPTSYTIAIGDLKLMHKKIKEADDYKILKIKLGSEKDKEIVGKIREETDKLIRVDANEGWTLDVARSMCNWLEDKNVELIEQPLKAVELHLMKELKQASPIPLIADENCLNSDDIPQLADSFHGINIKLMKCGGCEEVPKMIRCANDSGLKVMLGCMVESSVGITAMSQFASQADFLDLDGHLLIKNDPYDGAKIRNGHPLLPDGNGLGLTLNSNGKEAGLT